MTIEVQCSVLGSEEYGVVELEEGAYNFFSAGGLDFVVYAGSKRDYPIYSKQGKLYLATEGDTFYIAAKPYGFYAPITVTVTNELYEKSILSAGGGGIGNNPAKYDIYSFSAPLSKSDDKVITLNVSDDFAVANNVLQMKLDNNQQYKDLVKNVDTMATNFNQALQETSKQFTNQLNDSNKELNDKIDTAKTELDSSIANAKNELNTTITQNKQELDKAIEAANNTITQNKQELDTAIEATKTSIEGVKTELNGTIDNAKSEINTSIDSKISQAKSEISTETDNKIETAEANLNQNIELVRTDISNITQLLGQNTEDIAKINEQIDDLQQNGGGGGSSSKIQVIPYTDDLDSFFSQNPDVEVAYMEGIKQ